MTGRDDPSGPSPLTLLIVAVILTVGGYFLSVKLRDLGRMQDCLMQGRTNCEPLAVPSDH
jgi:hypothetical protein